jgi:hypothetical protein
MKKTKISVIFLCTLTILLILPYTQAALPQVWFNEGSEVIWLTTQEELDASYSVISTETQYSKFNVSKIVEGTDHLNVTGYFSTASVEDVTTYGYENQSYWVNNSLALVPYPIKDAELKSKFRVVYNEKDVTLTDIDTLSEDDRELVLFQMGFLLDGNFMAAYFVYALVKAFGGSFSYEENSTSISDISYRTIDFNIGLSYGNLTTGHWDNVTCTADCELIYGDSSNVLLESLCNSTLEAISWNDTTSVYDTEIARTRTSLIIKYPDELVNDYPYEPNPRPDIPGYQLSILLGILGIAIVSIYFYTKRKQNS